MRTVNVPSSHDELHHWYRLHGRHELPWRQTRDPYRIYLSEIMLQQTRVETVLERFYFPFLDRFPTLKDVAEASEEELLKAWEGLGYYSRARNLHRAAKRCGGELPSSVEELEALPGIGPSTARAIACFAFGAAVPILDANVRRILYRFFRRRKATERELWRMAQRLFDATRPYDYNQAMMDLGATICTPRNPRCGLCPLSTACRGREAPERYPAPRGKRAIPVRQETILLHRRGDRWGVLRSEERFHGGLWGFPRTEEPAEGEELGSIRQSYSHFTLEANVVEVARLPETSEGLRYLSPEEIDALPLGGADRKVLEMLKK
ncbi:A/G-specific adenine glycosylase [Nitratifractor sp.]